MPPQRTDAPSTPELRLADFQAFLQGFCVSPKHLLRWIWYAYIDCNMYMAPVLRGDGSG